MLFKLCLGILIFLFYTSLFAQTDTFYINKNHKIVEKNLATYRLVLYKTDFNYRVGRGFDGQTNKFLWTGQYKGLNTFYRHGHFQYYLNETTLIRTETYQNDQLEGEYKEYDNDGSTIKEIRYYHVPKGAYDFKQFDKQGLKILVEGSFDQYERKNGYWREYYENNAQLKSSTYYLDNRKIDTHEEYYESGQLKRREKYDYGKLKRKAMFDEKGKKMKYYPAFKYPSNKEALHKYLYRKSDCFEKMTKLYCFEVSFKVSTAGKISDVEIVGIENEACKSNLIGLIQNMENWHPGYIENKAISMRYKQVFKPYSPRD